MLAATPIAALADARLVVFEAQDCALCSQFRADVLPSFWGAASGEPVAMTIVDVDALGTAGYPLAHRLATLPTVVLMEDGRERARIEGPVGHEQLRSLIDRMRQLSSQ